MAVLEIAEYALAPNVSEESFLAARPAMEDWLRRQPGFQSLRLVRDGARWMDVCEWQDLTSAQAAAATFMEDPGVAAFMATLDESTATMRHLEVVGRA
jgi:hypothetical protein